MKTKKIKLNNKQTAIVDDLYYDLINKYKWKIFKSKNFDITFAIIDNKNKRSLVFMHHLILQPLPGFYIDHINDNGLDNRLENLKLVTHRENQFNKKRLKISLS